MPAFLNPFSGNLSGPMGKMSTPELIRALRLDLANELEAIATYEAHADACEDEFVAEMLRDISKEESVHSHELSKLIEYLEPSEKEHREKGIAEVNSKADEMKKNLESTESETD